MAALRWSSKISSSGTTPSVVSKIRARGAMVSTRARSCASWHRATRSVLLITTMSAVLIWSRARSPYPAFGSTVRSASISEIMLWTSTKPCAAGDRNVSATATGRDTPLVSMTMWSGSGSRSKSLITSRNRSSRIVQQTQPLARLMVSPSTATISLASMLIEPKSLTRTAIRRPSECCRIWLTSEVLPQPRNPPMMVSGNSEAARDPSVGGVSLESIGCSIVRDDRAEDFLRLKVLHIERRCVGGRWDHGNSPRPAVDAAAANENLVFGDVEHHQISADLILPFPMAGDAVDEGLQFLRIDRAVAGHCKARVSELAHLAQRFGRRMRIGNDDLCYRQRQASRLGETLRRGRGLANEQV